MKSRLATIVACCLVLPACGTIRNIHIPNPLSFFKKETPAPEAVNELNLVNADGSAASYPQYWKRNTLVIDLSGVGGQGSVSARLPDQATWPVRVAVRVRPGSVGQLEIQAEERNVLPVTPAGGDVIDIELAPTVYTPRTAAIYIGWGPTPVFAEVAPEPVSEPVFTSPTEVPEKAPSANDIVSPAEAAPPQPSPPQPSPPGS